MYLILRDIFAQSARPAARWKQLAAQDLQANDLWLWNALADLRADVDRVLVRSWPQKAGITEQCMYSSGISIVVLVPDVRSDGVDRTASLLFVSLGQINFVLDPGTSPGAAGTLVYLDFYGTGFRGRSSVSNVLATLGGISVPALYAGPQSQYLGLDQLIVGPLPRALAGKGATIVSVNVNGTPANALSVVFQ